MPQISPITCGLNLFGFSVVLLVPVRSGETFTFVFLRGHLSCRKHWGCLHQTSPPASYWLSGGSTYLCVQTFPPASKRRWEGVEEDRGCLEMAGKVSAFLGLDLEGCHNPSEDLAGKKLKLYSLLSQTGSFSCGKTDTRSWQYIQLISNSID